jgi:hypothetical protein
MRVTVFDVGIVNYKGSRAEIGVGMDDRGAVLSTNVIRGPLVGFNGQAVLIGERVGSGDGFYIICFTVSPGTEVTITNKPVGLKFVGIHLPVYH